MTIFGKLFKYAGTSIESLLNNKTGAGLSQAQREQNNFNASQAEISYDRQKEFYEQYQSPSAMMNQYQAAGLNPALMYGQAAGGSVASTPQAQASSVSMPDMMADLLQLKQIKKNFEFQEQQNEIAKYDAETRRMQAENDAPVKASQARYNDVMSGVNQLVADCKKRETDKNIESLDADISKKQAEVSKLYQETDNLKMQQGLIEADIKLSLAKITTEATMQKANMSRAELDSASAQLTKLKSVEQSVVNQFASKREVWNAEQLKYAAIDMCVKANIDKRTADKLVQMVFDNSSILATKEFTFGVHEANSILGEFLNLASFNLQGASKIIGAVTP